MKLRAIELVNVRRFAGQRAVLGPIGDGITVLSEPNEFGKSTFFDALHALFFERHRSTRAAVKALQPHAGGAPEVTVEVDLPDGRFRIAKRWLSRPQARVADAAGRPVAQDDEAEAWVDRLLDGGLAGPSGLLWVRQGLLGIEPEGAGTDDKRERERGLATRRDLLSSVAGEIELMTGGRRMDAVLDRVAAELGRLATATGKPKADGDWARAVKEAADLSSEETALRKRADGLSGDLAQRAEAQRRLSRLADPAEASARAAALQQAETAHRAAREHRARVDQAETDLRLATAAADAARHEVERLDTQAARVEQARTALAGASTQADAASARADDLSARDRLAATVADTAARATRDLRNRLSLANRARAAQAARAQAEDLRTRLQRTAALQSARDADLTLRRRLAATPRSVEAAEKAQAALDLLRARAEAQAVTVEARPDGAARASIDGAPLPDGPRPIRSAAEIVLPGFGTLRVDPGSPRGADPAADLAKAAATLDRALAACGAATVAAARQAFAEAQRLDAALAQAAAVLAEIAPDGTDALRAALAVAVAEADEAPAEAGDAAALAQELAGAERAEAEAQAAARAAHALAVEAGEARAQAAGERHTAARHLADALAEAGDPAAMAAARATGRARQVERGDARQRAADALRDLRATAPDLATAEARLARARGAAEAAAREETTLRGTLRELDTRIEVLAEEGLEERLSDLAGRLAEATARAARYEAEVRALARLRRALDEARASAHDAYFGPVLRELQPLLSILHPGAVLSLDDHSLLPAVLTRDGQPEPLDILSGGTREQVAVLTRLAFARLFATAGRPVPVILDDALVHSDDDRIEAMFTALHRVARDQQIVVFTCRQRAFAALGGTRATMRLDPA